MIVIKLNLSLFQIVDETFKDGGSQYNSVRQIEFLPHIHSFLKWSKLPCLMIVHFLKWVICIFKQYILLYIYIFLNDVKV